MRFKSLALSAVAAAATTCGVAYGGVLIDAATRNGSFELLGGAPGTAKATNWDTDPDGDVDAWTEWGASVGGLSTANGDSGADQSGFASNGTRVGFLQPGNAAYNLTSYAIQVGDVFTYSWDWVNNTGNRTAATATLAYQDALGNIVAIPGTDTTNPDNLTPHLGLGMSLVAASGDAWIGRPIGLTVHSIGTNWPEVDNFRLSVNVLPGDVNEDGQINSADFAIIRDHFRQGVASRMLGDLTLDGKVDFLDFIQWRSHASAEVLAAVDVSALVSQVPEPSAVVLVGGLAGAMLLKRRRMACRRQG